MQNTPRREILPVIEEGITLFSADHYIGNSSFTFVCGSDLKVNDGDLRGRKNRCAARVGTLVDSLEAQGLLFVGGSGDVRIGAGFSYVLGEATEFHASGLYLRKNTKLENQLLRGDSLLASEDPMVLSERNNDFRFLLGFTHTWKNNISGTFEYWRDDSGYTEYEWQSLLKLSVQQQQLATENLFPRPVVDGNQAWSSQVFLQQNIMEDYMAVRFAKEVFSWDVSGYLVYSIPDDGWFFTASLSGDVSTYHNLDLGVRVFGGKHDSVYENFPINSQVYISWVGALDL